VKNGHIKAKVVVRKTKQNVRAGKASFSISIRGALKREKRKKKKRQTPKSWRLSGVSGGNKAT
jgi:hypothetical protein